MALGGVVALFMIALPMKAALASSVIGAFVILALVDTRAALFSLVFVRASIDVTATVPLLSASGSSNVNAAAMMSFLIIGLSLSHISLSRINIWRIPLVKPFAVFLAIAFVGIAWRPTRAARWRTGCASPACSCCTSSSSTSCARADDRAWILRVMLLSSVIPLALGFYQFFTDTGNHETAGLNRIKGTFTHPSPYASYLVQLVPLAARVLSSHELPARPRRLVGLIPVMVFSIYATQTRVAWIGLVVVVMVFMSTRARWTLLFVPLWRARCSSASPASGPLR